MTDGPTGMGGLTDEERAAVTRILADRRTAMNVQHYALDFLELAHHALEKLLTGQIELSTPDDALKAVRAGVAGYKELAQTLRVGGFGDDEMTDEELRDPEAQRAVLAEVEAILATARERVDG